MVFVMYERDMLKNIHKLHLKWYWHKLSSALVLAVSRLSICTVK